MKYWPGGVCLASLIMVISKPLDASKFAHSEKVPMKRTKRRRIRMEKFDKGIRLVSQASLASNEEEVAVVVVGRRDCWRPCWSFIMGIWKDVC